MRVADRKEACLTFRIALFLFFLLPGTTNTIAELLPIKTYTTTDGLARDSISAIAQDSRGYLWFCTPEGLSRFDGYRFTNYGKEHGLPDRRVNDFLESHTGDYWVATDEGLCRFNPDPPSPQPGVGTPQETQQRFEVYRPSDKTRHAVTICEDRVGSIWCGSYGGLFRLDKTDGRWAFSFVDIIPEKPDQLLVKAIIEDRQGSLWIGTEFALYRRRPDGAFERYGAEEGLPTSGMSRVLYEDGDGRMWVGTTSGLYELVSDPKPHHTVARRIYTTRDGLSHNTVTSVCRSSDGRLWVGTPIGLSEFLPGSNDDSGRFRTYTGANGLSDVGITALAADRSGNLWVGTYIGGAMRLAVNGLTTYKQADGLGGVGIASIFENRTGELYVINGGGHINRFDGSRFTSAALTLPRGITYWGWGWYQVMFQDRAGEWWMNTGQGLVRYPKLSGVELITHTRPKAIYTSKNGLPADEVFRLFEDSHGDIWISTLGRVDRVLSRWERSTESFHWYSPADGVPAAAPTAFSEDGSGNLWIGFYDGGLLRYSAGRFMSFTGADGLPPGFIEGLYLDRAGRLWVATAEGGVGRIDDPGADRPRFVAYTTAEGLSSNLAKCVTEDQWGMIYVGTGRGVDQLDPTTGRIKHYTTADGLANSLVNVCFRDRQGALWFGTLQGVSRLNPQPEPTLPPPIFINALRFGGVPYQISALGAIEVTGPELTASDNQIQIDFVGVSLAAGESLRYQYKLEGASSDWGAPTDQRTVNYPNLAPGTYNFVVRAIGANGASSEQPARVAFKILLPLWRRWWFLALAGLLVSSVVFAFARSRIVRLRAARESDKRFRTLAETASDAIITIDHESRIVLANQAAERVFGYSIAEMLGKDLTMLMPEYLRHLHHQGFRRYKETGTRHISWQAIELPGLHKSGHEIPLEISFGEFTKNDRRFFTGIARDITERKRAEEERRQAEEALRRSREERLSELERVRRRIATDLHDDIGSSLTRISLLSEVVQRQIDGIEAPVAQPLSSIARLSRELVDSMSDIVWAINPKKDHLSDLSQRMRHFASDILSARGIDFVFRAPDAEQNIRIGANFRREVYLIFKEAVNNIVRHSGCSEANLEFRAEADSLFLRLSDNGRGFDGKQESGGHGLTSMRERTEGLGGKLVIVSEEAGGTTLAFTIPLINQDQASSSGLVAGMN